MKIQNQFLILAVSAMLTACGGGGGGGGGVPAAPSNAEIYHYYSNSPSASSAIGGLFSVNSAAPLSAVPVDVTALASSYLGSPNKRRSYTVDTGTLNAATGAINNYRQYAIVYAASGRLWKQYTNQAPAPIQISNLTTISTGLGDGQSGSNANDLCYMNTVPDFAVPENSVIVYGLAGPDTTCDNLDDTYAWLRLNTGTGTAPTAYTSFLPVAPVYNSIGAITNFIVLDASGALVKLDANFAGAPTAINGGAGPFPYTLNDEDIWVTHLSPTRILLNLPGGGIDGELRIVDAVANTLTGVLGTIANRAAWAVGSVYNRDSANVYFVGNNGAGALTGLIQRFPVDGSTAATPFYDAGAVQIGYLLLSNNHVVSWQNNGSFTSFNVVSIPKAAGSPIPLATSGVGETIFIHGISGTGYVYYDRLSDWPNANPADRAEAIRADGTGLIAFGSVNGAQWAGFNFTGSFSLFGEFPYIDHLVVAEYTPAATTMAGSTLSVVNGSTATKNGTVVGVVPAGIRSIFGFVYGGTHGLWEAYDGDEEIFYVDTAVAGSLTRLTTDDVNQQLIE